MRGLRPTVTSSSGVLVVQDAVVGREEHRGPNHTTGDGCWVRSAFNIERGILLPGAYAGESAHLEDRIIGPYCVPRENASAVQSSFARRKRGFEDSFRGVVRAHRRKGGASDPTSLAPQGLFRPHADAAPFPSEGTRGYQKAPRPSKTILMVRARMTRSNQNDQLRT